MVQHDQDFILLMVYRLLLQARHGLRVEGTAAHGADDCGDSRFGRHYFVPLYVRLVAASMAAFTLSYAARVS